MSTLGNGKGREVQEADTPTSADGVEELTYCFTGLHLIRLTEDYMNQYKREFASQDLSEESPEDISVQDQPQASEIPEAGGPSTEDLQREAIQEIISGMSALLDMKIPPKISWHPTSNISIPNPLPISIPNPSSSISISTPNLAPSSTSSPGHQGLEEDQALDPRALAARLEELTTQSGQQTPQPAQTPVSTVAPKMTSKTNKKKRKRGLTPPTDGLHWDAMPVPKKMKGVELEEGELAEEEPEHEIKESGEDTSKPKKQRKRKRRYARGSRKNGPQGEMSREEYLHLRRELRTVAISSSAFSLVEDARVGGTGWMGAKMDPKQRERIAKAWENKEIKRELTAFKPVQADLKKTLVFVDCHMVPFLALTDQSTWMATKAGPELVQLSLDILVDPDPRVPPKPRKVDGKVQIPSRGPHEPVIIGHDRPYDKAPALSKYHRLRLDKLKAYIESEPMQAICKWLRGVLERLFKGVLERYDRNADWHFQRYGIKRMFDPFWNFCFNACYPGQDRVHCRPHTDHKNIVGVCVVIPYLLPGSTFDYKRRSWLVIWEAGVIIEMPPWTAVIYPSSLFFHFNIDIHDIQFIDTYQGSLPEKKDAEPGDVKGRGSMVFFNQASMFQSSELDFDTVAAAKLAGHEGKSDFPADIQAAFQKYSQFVDLPKPSTT
ncbi:hypothetical protein BDN72DRAFT_906257 [Pluteus cervinus]|uniref:Uncharacterized protein n=1 Tax=Pluteus cervinus TaxID=181527 RepID=A0ACD3A0M0_9AGAR|nr:hypothetical protein BDN72DRAFT_906257 [Pluteus cervinus]